MLIRQAFFRWLVAAVLVLPIWLAVGWAVFGGGGWGTLGLIIAVPVAFIALGIVALARLGAPHGARRARRLVDGRRA